VNEHAAFDEMIRTSFCHIAEISSALSDEQTALLHLPQRMGGMGLTSYERIGPIAYECSSSTDPNAPDQRTRTEEFNQHLIKQLPDALQRHLSITERAGATAWLRLFTSCSRPQAFALALQHRIRHFGNFTLRTRCNACETELDSDHWDAHALGCAQRKGYNVTHRHNRIRAAIARVFREHGTDVQEEVKVTDDLRMDLVIYQDNNREMWVDLTVFTTDSKSNLKKAVEKLDNKAHKIKEARYNTEAERQNAEFTALPFDVHGGFGSHSASVFARFGKIANASPDEFVRAAVYALQIGNGMILMAARKSRQHIAFSNSRNLHAAAIPQAPNAALALAHLDAADGDAATAGNDSDDDGGEHGLRNTPAPMHAPPPSLQSEALRNALRTRSI
jgi:hypothetical protein